MLTPTAAGAQTPDPLAGVPLLAFYPFEGNASDASGNGRHGTVNGPILTDGYEGQAYAFDGLNDFIRADVNINPAVAPRLTMGAWVKTTTSAGDRQVISHDNGAYARTLLMHGGLGGWAAASGSGRYVGFEPAVLNQWTFIAVVYDQPARTVTLYVEDKVTGNLDLYQETGSLPNAHTFIRLGSNPRLGLFFRGSIDNAFVISDAMTSHQIAAIRTGGAEALARLTPGASIEGRVLADELPVANAAVQVCDVDNACTLSRSGPDGTYRAQGLAAGQYHVTAYPPPQWGCRLPGYASPPPLAPAEARTGVDVRLPPCVAMSEAVTITHRYIRNGIPVVHWQRELVLTAAACPGGPATYQIVLNQDGTVLREGPMVETSPGQYRVAIAPLSPAHGLATVQIRVGSCPDIRFPIYIDPSGNVRTTDGLPIPGATVTLHRSDAEEGPFEVVADGSAVMSPANRVNPDLTDASGHFGWDVLTGYYFVRAEKSGCVSPANPAVSFVDSRIMAIPPPVTDLDLRLSCPVANRGPQLLDDTAATDEDTPLVVPVGALLANDTDPDGDPLTVTAVSPGPGTHGTVALAGGTVTYAPAPNYNGPAVFTYTVEDGRGATAVANVTVTVRAVNDPPVATDDSVVTDEDTPLAVPVATLLANDVDPDGDTLTVTVSPLPTTHGTATLAGGTVTYAPALNYNGPAAFTYTVDDGHGRTASATVTVAVRPVNDAPVCASVVADRTSLWPADHSMRTVALSGATDPDGDPVTITVTTVTQDEAVNGQGDGDTGPDAARSSLSSEVSLRAERSGTGDGRVYRVGFTAADPNGGTCTGLVKVGVPKNQGNGGQPVESPLTVNSFGS